MGYISISVGIKRRVVFPYYLVESIKGIRGNNKIKDYSLFLSGQSNSKVEGIRPKTCIFAPKVLKRT
jgi:hypothetical protein